MPPPPRKGLRSSPPRLSPLPEKAGPSRSAMHCRPSACPGILTAEVVEAGEIHDFSPKSHAGAGPPGPLARCHRKRSGRKKPTAEQLRAGSGHCTRSPDTRRDWAGSGTGGPCQTSFRCASGRRNQR